MKELVTAHGTLRFPAFLPDATRAVVRTVDSRDLASCGITGLMVNQLHLSSHPGTSAISSIGGIHAYMSWNGPVASDSGGFQVLSLISGSKALGSVAQDGFTYRLSAGHDKEHLSPEKCIQRQLRIGADVLFCLDYCTHPAQSASVQKESVELTIKWARSCKEEFQRRAAQRKSADGPKLFAVVQGGDDRDLRRKCAEQLLAIGFDGYGFGGWPVKEHGELNEMVRYVRELIPEEYALHALGIGNPSAVRRAAAMGYSIFDCALPTRDARRGRLFVRGGEPDDWGYLYIGDSQFVRDTRPPDDKCDCMCCGTYSRAYLHHLFGIGDPLAHRLATIHNLRFYVRLMDSLADPR